MSNHKKPDNIPNDVWNAYSKWTESKGTHDERLVYWDKFLEIRKRYKVTDGKWSQEQTVIQTTLF